MLHAELPPLPAAMLLLGDGDYVNQKLSSTLTHPELTRAFLLYNANRKRLSVLDDATQRGTYEARVRHMEDYLTRANLPLVAFVYQRSKKRLSIDADEAFSVGNEAMVRAIRKFDLTRGFRFATLAYRCIFNAMISASQRHTKQTRRMPTMDVLDKFGREQVAASEPDAEMREYRARLYDVLRDNAAGLTTQERLVLQHRFLGNRETLHAVGKRLGVSKERCRQIAISAVEKLRVVLAPPE